MAKLRLPLQFLTKAKIVELQDKRDMLVGATVSILDIEVDIEKIRVDEDVITLKVKGQRDIGILSLNQDELGKLERFYNYKTKRKRP